MSFRAFMYAADALRLEDGVSFVVAAEPGVAAAPVQSPADVKARNAQSMSMLQGLLGGLKNAPGSKR